MIERSIVSTPRAPAAIGPYSQAVTAGGFVFCSGQVALDPTTQTFAGGTVEEQTRRVLENLGQVLEAAGSGLERVVKTTVFVADMNDFTKVNEVYAGFFDTAPPARATVEVARLPKDALVEIDCIALVR